MWEDWTLESEVPLQGQTALLWTTSTQHNKGGKYRQKQILDVGTDDDPHYDEVRVAAVLNEVGTGMATALNQVGEVAVPRSTQPL